MRSRSRKDVEPLYDFLVQGSSMSLKQQGCTLRTECEQMVSHVYNMTSVGSVHLDVVPCCNEKQ